MPSYFVCAIKFALQLGHDLFCNRHGFCSQLVGLVAISPSKLGHSTLKVVSLHRGSERKTRTKNRNIMIKCKKRMWTTFQSERTLSVCVSLWGFTSTSWVKHSFALSRTCNFFSLIGELLWRNTPIPINSSRNQIRHTNQPFSKSTQHCWYAQRERVFGVAEKEWKKWNEMNWNEMKRKCQLHMHSGWRNVESFSEQKQTNSELITVFGKFMVHTRYSNPIKRNSEHICAFMFRNACMCVLRLGTHDFRLFLSLFRCWCFLSFFSAV